MATITILVTEDANPVEGAEVVIGAVVGKSLTTNASGEVTKTVDEDYKIVVFVSILADGELRHTSSSFLLVAGGAYTFDITYTG